MQDQTKSDDTTVTHPISRRKFTTLSIAIVLAAVTGVEAATSAAAVGVTEVDVRTPSGICDAALAHPQGYGRWPAVIMFPDEFGLRLTMREMAGRLAAVGYTVLVPKPFYRSTKAPGTGPNFDFQNPADRARLTALRARLTNVGRPRTPRRSSNISIACRS